VQLRFRSYGHGPALVVLHGLLGSSDNWHTLGNILGNHFHTFILDQRNHGRSPHADEFNYRVLAEDVREFLRQHGIRSAHVLGHSMGGKTAMQFALTYPNLVNKLVVVDIAPKPYPALHDEIPDVLTALDMRAYSSRQEVDNALTIRIPDVAMRQFLLKNLKRDESGSLHWKPNVGVIRDNYAAIAKAVVPSQAFPKPTLFVRSNRSGYVLDDDIPLITEMFADFKIVTLDAGHWIHAETPEEFGRIVLDFLEDSPPSGRHEE